MAKRDQLAAGFARLGVTSILQKAASRNRLTVLAYHRITEITAVDFRGFEPNVSASPAMFEQQMAYISQQFNVISLADLLAWLFNARPLPPYPLLITFDDGYLDNYQNAFPILKKYRLPAIIFLMTSRMDAPQEWAWWDLCAYYFKQTRLQSADLPLLGQVELASARGAFMEQLKTVADEEKYALLGQLSSLLDVPPPPLDAPFFMTWEQVKELVENGVACQPHTVNHPILTRIPLEIARQELKESRDVIHAKTGQDIQAFAYPNGQLTDYNPAIIQILRELDYRVAFTLSTGPITLYPAPPQTGGNYPRLHTPRGKQAK